MDIKRNIVNRLRVIYVLIALGFIMVGVKIIYLQFVEDEIWAEKSQKRSFDVRTVEPNRGNIYSADGKLLATSLSQYRILIDLNTQGFLHETFKQNLDSISVSFSEIFQDRTPAEYKKMLEYGYKTKNRYLLIKKEVGIAKLKEVKKIPFFAHHHHFKTGLIVEKSNTRIMPHKELARRTIGFMSKKQAATGYEKAYDFILKGKEGHKFSQLISQARKEWKPLNYGIQEEAIDGRDIITTLDVRYQDIVEKALLTHLAKHKAEEGSIVLMEVNTGEIKAIANMSLNKKGYYRDVLNFAIGRVYEPGSTFKLASLIAILEDGYVSLIDSVNTGNGVEQVTSKYRIKDSKHGGYGKITVQQVLEFSSNIGISKLVRRYYQHQPEKFINRLYSMGLGRNLDLEFEGEGKSFIRTPGSKNWWPDGSLSQISMGYEVNITPLQLLTFYNAVANNGKMIKPKFVRAQAFRGEITEEYETEVINPAIATPETIKAVQQALIGVVERGTARNIKNKLYSIAGKTGTAQLVQGNQGYRTKEDKIAYSGSFVGYFPADNPKFSCIVVIKRPHSGKYYGSQVAAPAFKEVADKVFAINHKIHAPLSGDHNRLSEIPYSKNANRYDLLSILNDLRIPVRGDDELVSDWAVTKKTKNAIELKNRLVKDGQMPLLVGMGAKDAVYIAESLGLQIIISGRGLVRKQSVKAGNKVHKGEQILLELS